MFLEQYVKTVEVKNCSIDLNRNLEKVHIDTVCSRNID